MIGILLAVILLITAPLMAAEPSGHQREHPGPVATIGPVDKPEAEDLLHGLFDQALATIREYVEVEGNLSSPESRRTGEFRLRLFPQGKSRSQEHLTAEGTFHLSPDTDQQEFTLRFKSSKPSQRQDTRSGEFL